MKTLLLVLALAVTGYKSWQGDPPPTNPPNAHWVDVSFDKDGSAFSLACNIGGRRVGKIEKVAEWYAFSDDFPTTINAFFPQRDDAVDALNSYVIRKGPCR